MLRILIVDDSDSLRFILKAFFKKIADCDEAVNGRQAVEMVDLSIEDNAPYDAILMDIMMPEVDGLDATKTITTNLEEQDIPMDQRPKIVMLTCLGDPKHMVSAQYECGADAYITKPFEREILFETLENLGVIEPASEGS